MHTAGEEDTAAAVAVAGRIVARRVMGKLAFVSIRDDRGTVQLYVDKVGAPVRAALHFKSAPV